MDTKVEIEYFIMHRVPLMISINRHRKNIRGFIYFRCYTYGAKYDKGIN